MLLKLHYFLLICISSKIYAEIDGIDDEISCDEIIASIDDNDTSAYMHHTTTKVTFYLITPENESLELNSTNLNLFNASNPTKILIHGLETHENHLWIDRIVQLYHTKGNYNVIAVDWSIESIQVGDYLVEAVDSVGNILGIFVMQITDMDEQILSETHLIGSSVGAQISGVAGETVAQKGGKIGRITGLDPTVPDSVDRLDGEDADFVDVIHTGVYLGERRSGVVDFYVVDQNGTPICYYSNNSNNDTCENLIASDYYIKTVEDAVRFEGISCSNTSAEVAEVCDSALMGEYVPRNISGSYFVAKGEAAGVHSYSRYVMIFSIVWSLSLLIK